MVVQQPKSRPLRVGLTFSGRQIMSDIFHLGVVAVLRELGILKRVNEIASVPVGSILAPHLVLKCA
jgi:hypothetical protein